MSHKHAKHDKKAAREVNLRKTEKDAFTMLKNKQKEVLKAYQKLQDRHSDYEKASKEVQKTHAEVENLKASVIGSKFHSGRWRDELLRAAKDYDFDNI